MAHKIIKPYYSEYSTEISRLSSFNTWPKALSQKPSEMADAGLFYTGQSDKVICYFCGGGMKDWFPDDKPWKEHARFFQSCPYVLIMKGEEYVIKIASERKKPACESKQSTNYETLGAVVNECVKEPERMTTETNLICKICLENELNTCFIPCGHAVACAKCSLSLNNKCPICRKVYFHSIKIFF